MSYRRFDNDDIVVSADSITTPAWTNNVTNLTQFYSSSVQAATNAGKYYYHIYNSTTANQEIQFSIAYGNKVGSGSALYDNGELGKGYSSTVYGQYRTLLNGDEDTNFKFISGSETREPDSIYFISLQRARFKEKILPGTLLLKLGSGSKAIELTDNSKNVTTDSFTDAGRVYSIYSASAAGTVHSTDIEYGKIYPDVGIITLDAAQLVSQSVAGVLVEGSGASTTYTVANDNKRQLLNSIKVGASFRLRSDETLSSNFIFVRARNSEFNYSTNPSNITGSGELRHSVMIDNPQSYITQVGLYNDSNDLLAVAKLSTPLLKDFTKEALVRIKLDY
jgi:hypothetical protein